MPKNISDITDTSSIHYESRALENEMTDIAVMENHTWRARLNAAVEASGKSMRAISLDAGAAPGYVHSILKEDKEPTIGKLVKVAESAGVSLSYILYGYEMTATEEDLLKIFSNLSEEQKSAFLQLARSTARTD